MRQIATGLRLIAPWAAFSLMLAAQPLQITSVPTGLKPLGIAAMNSANPGLFQGMDYLVVANSGDNSVSVFSYNMFALFNSLPPTPVTVIQGIPDPHAVIRHCGDPLFPLASPPFRFIVTSPSDNSIRVVQVSSNLSASITRIPVGQQPVSVACFQSSGKSIIAVSNYADQTVTLIDGASYTVTATVSGIPGNAGLHGIGGPPQGSVAWIAGTDANRLTLLDVNAGQVLSQISVAQPLAIQGTQVETAAGVLSFDATTLQPTTVLTASSVRLYAPTQFGTFAIAGDSAGPTSLNVVSSGNLYPIPQASNPQDMMVRQSAACTNTSRRCSYFDGQLIVTNQDSNSLIVIPPPVVPHDFDLFSTATPTVPGGASAAPGSLATIFVPTGVSQPFSAATLPLPTSWDSLTLRIGGSIQLTPSAWVYSAANSVQAPLLYVGPDQINFQVPPGTAPGLTSMQLQRPDGTTLLTTVGITTTAPAIFTVPVNGNMRPAVLNQDNTLNSPDNPAPRGTVIQIFATGGGDTTPLLGPGEAAPANGDPLVTTNMQPKVIIGSISAPVIFSGLAPGFIGLWQINVVIPQDATPGAAVWLDVETSFGIGQVTIAIQ